MPGLFHSPLLSISKQGRGFREGAERLQTSPNKRPHRVILAADSGSPCIEVVPAGSGQVNRVSLAINQGYVAGFTSGDFPD